MRRKSLIIFIMFTAFMCTNLVIADPVVLTAELSGSKFNPGEIVEISGNLTNVLASVNITINILNGTDYTLIDSFNLSTVDDAKDNFTATYNLTDAEPGEYIANITYGDSYVELDFEVEALEHEGEPEDVETVDQEEVEPETCENLSFAIERSELYLQRVRDMLEGFVEEYNELDYPNIYAKLQELNAMLDLAEEYLADATEALEEGDCNAAARSHAAARNLIGRIKGILSSVIKEHKVQKTERFMEQFERRINSTKDKISQLAARFGTANAEGVNAKLGNAWGVLKKLEGSVNTSNVDEVLQILGNTTGQVDDDLEGLGDEEAVSLIKNVNRYEAKIKVLAKTHARLQKKNGDNEEIAAKLGELEQQMAQLQAQMDEMDFEGVEEVLEGVQDSLQGLKNSSNINNGKNPGIQGKAKGKEK